VLSIELAEEFMATMEAQGQYEFPDLSEELERGFSAKLVRLRGCCVRAASDRARRRRASWRRSGSA
jgi:hypothetical protein